MYSPLMQVALYGIMNTMQVDLGACTTHATTLENGAWISGVQRVAIALRTKYREDIRVRRRGVGKPGPARNIAPADL